MKTAMEELIDRLRIMANDRPSNSMVGMGIAIAMDLATELIEKEKQQIIDAWDLSTAATASDDTGIEYYNQTYKQND